MRRFACSVAFFAALAGAGAASAEPARGELEQAVRTSQAAIGRTVGDWQFTDHRGRALTAADLRGKPWVASFIYTGCFQVCPATTQFLRSAVKSARDALGPGRFRVVSIGFNQPFDTPEALAAFARQQGIADDDWIFVAPRAGDVEMILAQFGLTVKATPAGFDHLIQATVVDAENRIYRQVYGDAFELPMFIGPLKELLSGQAAQVVNLENIWLKVKLYCTVYDPTSGRYKFNYSLFVELFAGITFLGGLLWFLLRQLRRQNRAAPSG
ncbi:MAG: SCO family protein [Burkholderiales bacterium]|nr:SCO family protein [Burkholderiales bacterium]